MHEKDDLRPPLGVPGAGTPLATTNSDVRREVTEKYRSVDQWPASKKSHPGLGYAVPRHIYLGGC